MGQDSPSTTDISQSISLVGSYEFTYQQGLLGSSTTPTTSSGDIYHNVVAIGFEASQPYRVWP